VSNARFARRGPNRRRGRRSGRAWFVLGLRVAAAAGIVAAFALQDVWRWSPLVIAGGIVPTLIAMRHKTPARLGAIWIGSANLLSHGRRYSGQLSLTADSVAWIPSSLSVRRGVAELNLSAASGIDLKSGQALFDVVIVHPAIGSEVRFRTRKDPDLRRAVQALGASSSPALGPHELTI
jgi:hypothetical protein